MKTFVKEKRSALSCRGLEFVLIHVQLVFKNISLTSESVFKLRLRVRL